MKKEKSGPQSQKNRSIEEIKKDIIDHLRKILQLEKPYINYQTGETISKSKVVEKVFFANFVPNRPIQNIINKAEELKEPDETTPLKEKYTIEDTLREIGKDLPSFISKIQDEFLCPISAEIMFNPYVTKDTHTYGFKILETKFDETGRNPIPSPYGSQSPPRDEKNTIIYIHNNEIASNELLKKLIDLCQEAKLIKEEKFDLERYRFNQIPTSQELQLNVYSYREWRAELKSMLKKIPKIIAFYIVGAGVLIPDIILFNIVRRESLNPAVNTDALGSSCDDFKDGKKLSTDYLDSFKQLEAKIDKGLFFLLPLTLVFFIAGSNQTKWRKSLYFGMGVAFLFLLGSLLTSENPEPDLLTNILFTCLTASGFSDFCDTLISDEDAAKKTAKECIDKELGKENLGVILSSVYFAFFYTMIITAISQCLYDKKWHFPHFPFLNRLSNSSRDRRRDYIELDNLESGKNGTETEEQDESQIILKQ